MIPPRGRTTGENPMNRTYQLVWNASLRVVQVVSEIARPSACRGATGRPSARPGAPYALAAALALCLAAPASTSIAATLPTGATIISGTAAITGDTDTLTVAQTSQSLSIDWTNFQIGAGGTVT